MEQLLDIMVEIFFKFQPSMLDAILESRWLVLQQLQALFECNLVCLVRWIYVLALL
jgi:hypothetical protein